MHPRMQVTTLLLSWSHCHLKISNQLIQSKGKCRIRASTLVSTLNLSPRTRRLVKSSLRKRSPLLSTINVVYKFKCNLYDALYGCTTRHLHPRPTHQRTQILSNRQAPRGACTNQVCLRRQTIFYFEEMQIEV